MPLMMRGLVVAAALLLAAAFLIGTGARAAESWPARPVHVIVPFAPAGPTDAISRILADKLGGSLGQQFVVENRPGAGANIGIDLVAHAAPDGYTVLMVSSSIVVNP